MRQTLSRDMKTPSSFGKNVTGDTMKRDSSNPHGSLVRIKSPEPIGTDNYNGSNLRLSIQSPNAATNATTSISRIEPNPSSSNNRDSGVRGSTTFMSNAFNIVMKKP